MTRKRVALAPNMAVLKIFSHGDDRHSKNGLRTDVDQQNTYLVPIELIASWD
jgi:hypothetical protein